MPTTIPPAPNKPGRPEPIKKLPSKIREGVRFYDHQIEGIRWLARVSSWILADEQGLGKTIQSLTAAALDFDAGRARRVLVISGSKQLKYQWADEIEKFTHFTYHVLEGTPKQRAAQLLDFDADILIVNYEQIHKYVKVFNHMGFDIVIVDECHELKNPEAVRTKAAHQLKVKRWFLLSGTPVLNRPDELWSPLKLIDPNTPDYWPWVNKHCLFREGKVVGVKQKGALKAYTSTIMLRRLKADCLDLPEKQYVRVNVEMGSAQRQAYREVLEELQAKLPANPTAMQRNAGNIQALRLRQVCSTPANIGLPDDSAKLDVAVERAAELVANGHKVICFTQFRPTLACMEERLTRAGIPFYSIHGGVDSDVRNEMVRQWTGDSAPSVLLAMYQVAKVGLNLTAARHAIMIDKLYVPGLMHQAEDRIHRIGQDTTQPVQIIELIARNSYEEKIERILSSKGEMIDTLVPNSGWSEKLYELILERD